MTYIKVLFYSLLVVPEMYGPDSRCFEHDWMEPGDNVTGAGEGGGEGVGGGAGCYTYECRRRRVLVNVAGRVVVCRHAGQRVGEDKRLVHGSLS